MSGHPLVQRESNGITHTPLLAMADVDVESTGSLAICCSRHVKSGRTIVARENFQGTLGLLMKKRGKKSVDSG
jgi:hypothetical protein